MELKTSSISGSAATTPQTTVSDAPELPTWQTITLPDFPSPSEIGSDEYDASSEGFFDEDGSPEVEGEAEASVAALFSTPFATTDPRLFYDMVDLMESAERYDTCLEWFEKHLQAHRARIATYQAQLSRTPVEFRELERTTEELEVISSELKKMRWELEREQNRFRRRFQCTH